jgi:hypothetical protein
MGLDFLRAKGERFEAKCDLSKGRELDTEDLLATAKEDLVIKHYRCLRTDPLAEIIAGCALIAQAKSASAVVILQHARPIGHMLPEDAADFTASMRKNHRDSAGGLISLTIVDHPDLGNVFTVKPKRRFKDL